jgi:hypothetical protein
MPKGKPPPPHRDHPDYDPEPPGREFMGDDNPEVREYEPSRQRNAPTVSVVVTVVVVAVLGLLYFLFR